MLVQRQLFYKIIWRHIMDENNTSFPRPQPIEGSKDAGLSTQPSKRRFGWPLRVAALVIGMIVLVVVALGIWYAQAVNPVDVDDTSRVRVMIASGSTPSQIGDTLKEKGVIRSATAFKIHTTLQGNQGGLQAGTYSLSPSESLEAVVAHLVTGGDNEEISITFLPGATLADNKKVLKQAGYADQEIDAAFMASYDHPLLANRPTGSDLEGYIYGETHRFTVSATVGEILEQYFDDYYAVVQDNNLIAQYKKQGLSLHEGITLASVIQREAIGGDEPQIAQVFLSRKAIGMPLGSDVTYQYIADKEGNPRDTNYDSPYNTRRYPGLPPGPIAVPGVAALKAVASPAPGDYLYFLSGDDDVTYFGRTEADHQANIRNHCALKCQII